MYRADGTRLVLLPPKGDGAAVLLETTDPEKFMREVRQAWSIPVGMGLRPAKFHEKLAIQGLRDWWGRPPGPRGTRP
jgi:hypothetical protein